MAEQHLESIPSDLRSSKFIERLSLLLVAGAYLGGFIVLLDVKLTLELWGQTVQIGGDGFSPEVKGVVLQSMLITGFAAVVGYWLGTTKQGQDQAQAVSRIAEAPAVFGTGSGAAPNPAAPAPVKTDSVSVDATGADVTIKAPAP